MNQNEVWAREAWKSLNDCPIDDGDNIDSDWYVTGVGCYERGTNRFDIWYDIEEKFGISIAYLLGEAMNPDGSSE